MAQGTQRREGTPDSLAGASEITPTIAQAPELQVPNAAVPDLLNSMSSQVANSLNKWAGSKFQEVANVRHEASVLDGQMAYQQGKAMEDLDIPGDKWAMQGYRVMQAQTLSSTMLASQQELIRSRDYQSDPDKYRSTYVARMEQQIEGLDAGTAKMVREQMAVHMPTLVAQHTTAYMQNEEQTAFETLSASIGPLSKDATAFTELMSNTAGGANSATAGLSDDRRRAAIVEGTVNSFKDGNPLAYQLMKSSGKLDALPTAEREAIEASKNNYENKLRTTYDAEFNANIAAYNAKVDAGGFKNPQASVDELIQIFGERGITITAAEAGASYAGQKTAGDLGDRADVKVLQTALVSGDWQRVAKLTQDIVMFHESGGDPNAVSEAGATGLMQVMPATSGDPGYGVKPSDGTAEDTARVGRDYWSAMIGGSETHAALNWKAGDIEAAAIAYNAGPENAKKWIEAGRDYSVLPQREETEPYAKKILASANGEDLYYTSAERLSLANTALTAAQSIKEEIERQEAANLEAEAAQGLINRTDLYNQTMSEHKQKLDAGNMTGTEYRELHEAALEEHELSLSKTMSNNLINDIEGSIVKAATRNAEAWANVRADQKKTSDFLKKEKLAEFQNNVSELSNAFKIAMEIPGRSSEDIEKDRVDYLAAVKVLANNSNLSLAETKLHTIANEAGTATRAANKASKAYAVDQAQIDRAIRNGTVKELSGTLQERAFKQMGEENVALVSDAVATGTLTEEGSAQALAQANTASWIKAGSVPTDVSDHATTIMTRQLVTDGVPDPQMIAVVQQWNEIREDNPEVAATMFNEAGEIKAQALLELAGGSFPSDDSYSQAMIALQKQVDGKAALISGNQVIDQTKLNDEASKAVDNFFSKEHIGMLQGMLSSNADIKQRWDRLDVEERVVFSEEAREALSGEILNEAIRLQKLSPGQNADFYAKRAASGVLDRTSIVGDSILVMDKDFDLQTQMFGEAKSIMTKDGIEQEVILHAMKDLQEKDPDKYGYIGKITFREDYQVGRALAMAGDFIAGIFGGEVQRPILSDEDAQTAGRRGARPFVVETADNKTVGIRVRLPDGNLGPWLPIDLAKAGAAYRADYDKGLTQEGNTEVVIDNETFQ